MASSARYKLCASVSAAMRWLGPFTPVWAQVIECRRMLKWTYAYGYYSFEDEAKDSSLVRQRQFFEFQQGALESRLENVCLLCGTPPKLCLWMETFPMFMKCTYAIL